MKKLSILMLSLVVSSFTVRAQQETAPKFPEWDPKPKMHPIPPSYFNEHAVVILESEKRDYKYEGKSVTLYSTQHRLIKVLDRLGIESFNTISVPFKAGTKRVDSVKARVILPDGTTRDLKYEMLYLSSNSLFFALDGLEKNAEVEILVKYKELSSYFGSVHFQEPIPVLNSFFEINYPKNMFFNLKGYHGYPSGAEQLVNGHKQVKIYKSDIPALEREPMAFYDIYGMRLEYAIDHFNSFGGYQTGETFTWDMLAHGLYQDFYTLSESNKKQVNKFLTTIGLRGGESELTKIRKIEEGIKTTIVKNWELGYRKEGDNLDSIIAKSAASPFGTIKLFCAALSVAGVRHELGIVSDRRHHLMDSKFVNWQPLVDYIIYLPDQDAYLSPEEQFYRYPEVPASMLGNKGVFCRTNPETGFNVGKVVTEGEAIIRTITATAGVPTRNNLDVTVTLDEEYNAGLNLNYSYTGYSAAEYRKALVTASPKEKKRLVEEMAGVTNYPEYLKDYSLANEGLSSVYNKKPLTFTATVKAPHMVEKAGENYIIRIGEAIGHEENLYAKDERMMPVDLEYPYAQTHRITCVLPAGAKLKNPEVLRISAEHDDKNNGDATAWFSSDYKLEGNKLTVTVKETYTRLHYPVYEYEEFRKVINASADFNNLYIVLEPAKKPKPVRKAKAAVMPAPAVTPVGTVRPVAAVKPLAAKQAAPRPMQRATPAPEAKPAPANKPVSAVKPAPANKPVSVVNPAPANKPVSVVNPAPANKPVSAVNPAPANKPVSVVNPAPANKPVSAVKPAPANKPVSVVNPAPANKPVSVVNPAPASTATGAKKTSTPAPKKK